MHNTAEPNTFPEENSFEDLKNYDWEQLQERYLDLMEQHGRTEEQLQAQISNLLEVYRPTTVRSYLSNNGWPDIRRMVSRYCCSRRDSSIQKVCFAQLLRNARYIHGSRFKTQIEHVQNSEDTLEQKRKHCRIPLSICSRNTFDTAAQMLLSWRRSRALLRCLMIALNTKYGYSFPRGQRLSTKMSFPLIPILSNVLYMTKSEISGQLIQFTKLSQDILHYQSSIPSIIIKSFKDSLRLGYGREKAYNSKINTASTPCPAKSVFSADRGSTTIQAIVRLSPGTC